MGHPLAGSCVALNIIRSIAHDQPQKNFKYLWLDFRFGIGGRLENRTLKIEDSYAELFPDRVDVLLHFVVHYDGIGPFTLEALTAPLSGRIDAHLGAEAHDGSSMVQDIHWAFDKDDIPFGIDMVAHDPGDFGKILDIDVMIHNHQNFGKHHLAQAPQCMHDLPRMPRKLLLDRNNRQIMKHAVHRQVHVHDFRQSHTYQG